MDSLDQTMLADYQYEIIDYFKNDTLLMPQDLIKKYFNNEEEYTDLQNLNN